MLVNPADEGSKSPYDFKLIRGDQNVMEVMTSDGTRLKLPARIASSMIQRGHAGLSNFATHIKAMADKAGAGPARESRRGEIASDNQRQMARAERKSALDVFDTDVRESIHGPGGDEAGTRVSEMKPTSSPIYRRRSAMRYG